MVITKVGAVEPNVVSATLRELDGTAVRRACSLKLTFQVPSNVKGIMIRISGLQLIVLKSEFYIIFKLIGCKYGDRASWCANISTSECYVNADTCCQTCAQLRRKNDPGIHYCGSTNFWHLVAFNLKGLWGHLP